MQDSADKSETAFRELVRVLEEAVQAGVTAVGLERNGRELMVFHQAGFMGVGAARIPQELQQDVVNELVKRTGLSRKPKGKMPISLLGKDYEAVAERYDNFGEWAFNLTLREPKKTAAAPRKKAKASAAAKKDSPKLYTLEVLLIDGRLTEKFIDKNPVVSRTILIRGDQTLEDLHEAIFDAYGRYDEHLYEFQFGKKPKDRKAARYVPGDLEIDIGDGDESGGYVDETTIGSLGLKVRSRFYYHFDFGDDWWHEIKVEAVDDQIPKGRYPKLSKRIGKNPPQYPDEDY